MVRDSKRSWNQTAITIILGFCCGTIAFFTIAELSSRAGTPPIATVTYQATAADARSPHPVETLLVSLPSEVDSVSANHKKKPMRFEPPQNTDEELERLKIRNRRLEALVQILRQRQTSKNESTQLSLGSH